MWKKRLFCRGKGTGFTGMSGFFEFSVSMAGFIVFLPLIGAVINGLYAFSGGRQVHSFIHWVACGSVGIAFFAYTRHLWAPVGIAGSESTADYLFLALDPHR